MRPGLEPLEAWAVQRVEGQRGHGWGLRVVGWGSLLLLLLLLQGGLVVGYVGLGYALRKRRREVKAWGLRVLFSWVGDWEAVIDLPCQGQWSCVNRRRQTLKEASRRRKTLSDRAAVSFFCKTTMIESLGNKRKIVR